MLHSSPALRSSGLVAAVVAAAVLVVAAALAEAAVPAGARAVDIRVNASHCENPLAAFCLIKASTPFLFPLLYTHLFFRFYAFHYFLSRLIHRTLPH